MNPPPEKPVILYHQCGFHDPLGLTQDYPAGMSLRCRYCGWVAHYGDSAEGDQRMHAERAVHRCQP